VLDDSSDLSHGLVVNVEAEHANHTVAFQYFEIVLLVTVFHLVHQPVNGMERLLDFIADTC
jgi:hypothetical protein